jgi:hypothetical protein
MDVQRETFGMNELQKQKPWRSKKYLKWIRDQPCCVTGITEPSDYHHITTSGNRGMGTKTDDFYTIPLCHEEHQRLHYDPVAWEQKNGSQLMHWRKTITHAIRSAGINEFDRWVDGL